MKLTTARKIAVGTALVLATFFAGPRALKAEEPKFGGSAAVFARYDIKAEKPFGGIFASVNVKKGAINAGISTGIVASNREVDFDILGANAGISAPLGTMIFDANAYVYRDLQVGVDRGEGIGLGLGFPKLGAVGFAEHLKGNAYPLGAGVRGSIGPVSVKAVAITVAKEGSAPKLGGRTFITIKLKEYFSVVANLFIMSKPGAGEIGGITTQIGISTRL